MYCPNCGKNSDQPLPFCGYCGFSLKNLYDVVHTDSTHSQVDVQSSNNADGSIQKNTNSESAVLETVKTKKMNYGTIVIVVIVALVVILAITLSKPGHERIMDQHLKAFTTGDSDLFRRTLPPYNRADYLVEIFERATSSMSELSFTITDSRKLSDYELSNLNSSISGRYSTNVEISNAYRYSVRYDSYSQGLRNSGTEQFLIVKIGDKWYADPDN